MIEGGGREGEREGEKVGDGEGAEKDQGYSSVAEDT